MEERKAKKKKTEPRVIFLFEEEPATAEQTAEFAAQFVFTLMKWNNKKGEANG